MHNSKSIANMLLSLAKTKSDTVTPMQLMKLVYLCHGWMLGIHGRHLVQEPIEAWLYGPVIRDLYHVIKDYKSSAITDELSVPSGEKEFSQTEKSLIAEVYEKYGMFTGPQLSALTHAKGSPWEITWTRSGMNSTISNDLIEEYYRKQAQQTAA